jgi:hypothetical protein
VDERRQVVYVSFSQTGIGQVKTLGGAAMAEENRHEMGFGPGMMKDMMGKMMGDKGDESMMDRCMQMADKMAGTIREAGAMGSFATPEVRGLFEEWAKAVEEEILAFVKERGTVAPAGVALKLKISEESALFFIAKMAREKKLAITAALVPGKNMKP